MPSWAEEEKLPVGEYFKEPGLDKVMYREKESGRVWHLKDGLVQNVGVRPDPLRTTMGGGGAKEGASTADDGGKTLKERLLSKELLEVETKKALDK